jgi:hypothetical protein
MVSNASQLATAGTIADMWELSLDGAADADVQRIAQSLVAGRSPSAALDAIWRWAADFVRYQSDEDTNLALGRVGSEALIGPAQLVRAPQPAGDCDEYAMLIAALLLAVPELGIRPSFRTIAADPTRPDEFSHVYVIATGPAVGTVALDASHGTYSGWEARSGAVTRMGRTVTWVGGAQDWHAAALRGMHNSLGDLSLGDLSYEPPAASTWKQAAINLFPIAGQIALDRLTPQGYYRASQDEVRARGSGGLTTFGPLSSGSAFPWPWILAAAGIVAVVKIAGSSGGRR